jgi:hypothetical protein
MPWRLSAKLMNHNEVTSITKNDIKSRNRLFKISVRPAVSLIKNNPARFLPQEIATIQRSHALLCYMAAGGVLTTLLIFSDAVLTAGQRCTPGAPRARAHCRRSRIHAMHTMAATVTWQD